MTGPSRAGVASPDGAAPLAQRLAAVEARIHEDRHRQPAAVVEGIARLWSAGATVSAIAAETGVSPHIVRDRLRRAGALEYSWRERHRYAREVLGRDGARMIEAYEAGASMHSLAVGAGVSGTALRRFLVAEGIPLRSSTRGGQRKDLDAGRAELVAAYEAGAPIPTLADRAGVSYPVILRVLKEEGVALRDDRGRTRHQTPGTSRYRTRAAYSR
jgi:lambda repressor-like predicted transcriptional regulator